VRNLSFGWLALAWLPGCLLVQPLDDAKGSANGDSGGAGSGAHAGSGGASSNPPGSAGATASGGSGARGGATGASGAPSAGGPPSGVDFSLFTGTWTVISGTVTTTCDGVKKTTAATVGSTDTIDVGTDSDLIFDANTECPLLADVTDRVATGQPDQTCSFDDPTSGYAYDIGFTHFDFKVSGNGQTAIGTTDSAVIVTNPANNASQTCTSEVIANYTGPI
jgi:hypothetical protein